MDVKLEPRADHLRVVAKGAFASADARQGLLDLVQAAAGRGFTRVLVDGRGITTAVPIHERYDLATFMAAAGGKGLRVAIVVSPDNMFTKTLEDTATHRGLSVRTTASLDEALAFLGLPPEVG